MDDNSLIAVAIFGFVIVASIEIAVHKEDGVILSMVLSGIISILGFLAGKRKAEKECVCNCNMGEQKE